jgi:hypothetical protein
VGEIGQHQLPLGRRQEPEGAFMSGADIGRASEAAPWPGAGGSAGVAAMTAPAMMRSGAASGSVQTAAAATVDPSNSDAQMKKARQVMTTP